MDDIGFLLSVAFSGSDLSRALWLGLVGSLFCTSKFGPTHMSIALFVIDRMWPFVDMARVGYGMPEIAASLAYALDSLPRDATFHMIRFAGLYALCTGGYWLRVTLHKSTRTQPQLPLPY